MAIIKKSQLRRHIEELELRYEKLKNAAMGVDPNPNVYEQYSNNPDQYREEFVEVNVLDVKYALSDFRGVLKQLESIQKLQAEKLRINR